MAVVLEGGCRVSLLNEGVPEVNGSRFHSGFWNSLPALRQRLKIVRLMKCSTALNFARDQKRSG
ncbi:MAG: hypothetical protein DMF69_04185 [Acidobacteria bacterium]|nr:MAG: hypothetical protein DMF69_04185 [Acidobacteriota bacterium]